MIELVNTYEIETQEELADYLRKAGFHVTQATISRDIKQLHLIKEPTGGGRYRYAVSAQKAKLNFADRLKTILRESIVGVNYAQNIVVLHTMAGLAGAAGAAIDGMDLPTVVGTLAGDDTVMIVMRDTDSAREFCLEVSEMCK